METAYEVITGVGQLYLAAAGTAMPDVDAAPGASWTSLGETVDGVTVSKKRSTEKIFVDQRTGPVKAFTTEEGLEVETKLALATLENLAAALGVIVTDTPPGVGTIGTRSVPLYTGSAVTEVALLYRGDSPYGDYPAQLYIPRAFLVDDIELEFKKDSGTPVPFKVDALEDLSAVSDAERFGTWIAQDAEATS